MRISAFISASLLLGALAAGEAAAEAAAVATYNATYQVIYKGRNMGSSVFSVAYDEARDVYTFRSQTTAKGMLKLARPKPVVERSEFVVRDGQIRPLEFWYEDGSRKGEDNLHVAFDWDTGVAVVRGAANTQIDLTAGVLDRGSMQVAVMRDMAAGEALGPYVLADEDALKTYEYSLEGEERAETALGALATVRYRQQRRDSSRSTSLWAAPALQYLPVRIEQHRGGETDTVFVLQSVDGLGP